MSESLPHALQLLRQSTAALNAITDQANKTVSLVEKMLHDASIGIESIVVVREGLALEYCRVGGKFRLAVRTVGFATKAWTECSREVKLETITKLPALLIQISNKTTVLASAASSALSDINQGLFDTEESK